MAGKTIAKHQYWIMKSEPDCYSIDDLKREKRAMWDGVRNYQVRNMMRDEMQVGDKALFYHSSCDEIGVAGEMKIVKTAYPDPTQFDSKSDHPDPKSDPENPRWLTVDVQFVKKFPGVVSLQTMKGEKALHDMRLLQKGNRLSVVPITKKHYEKIVALSQK